MTVNVNADEFCVPPTGFGENEPETPTGAPESDSATASVIPFTRVTETEYATVVDPEEGFTMVCDDGEAANEKSGLPPAAKAPADHDPNAVNARTQSNAGSGFCLALLAVLRTNRAT